MTRVNHLTLQVSQHKHTPHMHGMTHARHESHPWQIKQQTPGLHNHDFMCILAQGNIQVANPRPAAVTGEHALQALTAGCVGLQSHDPPSMNGMARDPVPASTKSRGCVTKPDDCFTKPGSCFTKPGDCFTKPGGCVTKPGDCCSPPNTPQRSSLRVLLLLGRGQGGQALSLLLLRLRLLVLRLLISLSGGGGGLRHRVWSQVQVILS